MSDEISREMAGRLKTLASSVLRSLKVVIDHVSDVHDTSLDSFVKGVEDMNHLSQQPVANKSWAGRLAPLTQELVETSSRLSTLSRAMAKSKSPCERDIVALRYETSLAVENIRLILAVLAEPPAYQPEQNGFNMWKATLCGDHMIEDTPFLGLLAKADEIMLEQQVKLDAKCRDNDLLQLKLNRALGEGKRLACELEKADQLVKDFAVLCTKVDYLSTALMQTQEKVGLVAEERDSVVKELRELKERKSCFLLPDE